MALINILVDARALQDPGYRDRGIGSHCRSILSNFQSTSEDVKLHALIDSNLPDLTPENLRYFSDTKYKIDSPLDVLNFDAFIELSPFTHSQEPILPLLKQKVTKISFIYDFIQLDFRPEHYLNTASKKLNFMNTLGSLTRYDGFYAISTYSKRRLVHHASIPESKIKVTGVALRKSFVEGKTRQSDLKESNGKPYFITVLGEETRKNPWVVIEAFADFKAQTSSGFELKIVGKYTEQGQLAIEEKFKSLGGQKGDLTFVKHCSDEELFALYAGSTASISPSFIEGFSIPVIEALYAGTLVLASNCGAHSELIPIGELLFEPSDSKCLSRLMEKAFKDPEWRRLQVQSMQQIPNQFFEANIAQNFWTSVVDLVGFKKSSLKAPKKPSIAFLTPFPPQQSGVADYSFKTVQKLIDKCNVDVYVPFINNSQVVEGIHIFPLTKFPFLSGKYDRVISVVGNSHFHTEIIQLIKKFGGTVIIHDNRLVELYNWWLGAEKFQKLASQFLGRTVTSGEASSWVSDINRSPTLFFEEIFAATTKVIGHSRPLIQQIQNIYQRDVSYLPFSVYRDLNFKDVSREEIERIKKDLNIPFDATVVSTFGLVAPTKSYEEIIYAVQSLSQMNQNVVLFFAGEAGSCASRIQQLARELNIESRVFTCTEWISETAYKNFLKITNVAVQLRTHRFGGLSGAVLDCVSAGIPLVCNRDLGLAVEVPDYVCLIRDEYTSADIAEGILKAIQMTSDKLEVARQVDQFKRQHSFEYYTDELLKILNVN